MNIIVILVCPYNRKLRYGILLKYYNSWPKKDKFKALLQTSNKMLLLKLTKKDYSSNMLRKVCICSCCNELINAEMHIYEEM